jgi:hypothetical protein
MATRASRIALAGSNISSTGEVDADLLDNIDSAGFLSLAADGNFFIGTSSDIAPANGTNLYVSDGTISRFGLEKTGSDARKFSINNGGTYFSVYDETADAERLRITSTGRVGIGTTSPSTLLHVDGNTTLDGQVTIEGDVTINTNAKQFNFESDQERDNIYWSRNGVAHFFVIHATNGDLVFRNHASNNATGQINFESTIQVGNTAITAANAGAGALKYDNVLQISNGTDWKAVRMIGQDGSSSANAFDDLVEVAGLHSSDTSLWTTVQGYVSGGLQYTVDFTTPFTPKYQATNSNSGTYSTSGTFGGCSQGTGTGWTVWDAASYCMRGGARLCSLTELDANVVGGSGCSHDNRAIWTYTTNSNGHFYRGSGINSNSLNEGYVVGTNTSPTGYSINEIGVRCCGTSASGGALWEI